MSVPETPRTVLMLIIRSILKEDDIRFEDNFVELGGNSLMALQVANAMEQEAGTRIDVTQLLGDRIGSLVLEPVIAQSRPS